MKPWVPMVFLITIIGGGVAVAGAALTWWWWEHHGRQQVSDGSAEGSAYGAQADQGQCVAAFFERSRTRPSGYTEGFANLKFVGACLQLAERYPEFCAEIPARDDSAAVLRWRMSQCTAERVPESVCVDVLPVLDAHCQSLGGALGNRR